MLDRTFPYHFKMTPGILLGPRCNHDVGILAKFPVFKSEAQLVRASSFDVENLFASFLNGMYPGDFDRSLTFELRGASTTSALCCERGKAEGEDRRLAFELGGALKTPALSCEHGMPENK